MVRCVRGFEHDDDDHDDDDEDVDELAGQKQLLTSGAVCECGRQLEHWSFELRVLSFELRAMCFELQASSKKQLLTADHWQCGVCKFGR